jgi:nucleoside-diphosphate-sugar epimerase
LFDPSVPHPRYIITGGAGFVGSFLVKRLAAQSAPGQVKVIDNFWRGRMSSFQLDDGSWVINQRDVCALDLRNGAHTQKYIRSADYVYHLAGVDDVFGHQSAAFHDNLLINTNTLKASKVNNILNYIYASSACSLPQHRQMEPNMHARQGIEGQINPALPVSSCGLSKFMGEYEAQLEQSQAFNVGILRFHNIYGPGSDSSAATGQVIPSLLSKAIHYPKEPFIVSGSSSQYRDFVYVEDVVSALLLVKNQGMNKGVIPIGSGQPTTVKELAAMIVEIVGPAMGKTINIEFENSMPEGDRGRIAVLEHSKHILGWQPRWTLKQGVAATFAATLKQQNQSRVLVVLSGQPRGGEFAWKSLHRHVLQPLNAHLATMFTPVGTTSTRPMVEAMAQYVWRVPEPADRDWGVWMDKAATLCSHDGIDDWPQLCDHPDDSLGLAGHLWAGGFKQCPKMQSMSGVGLAYRWLISQKIMALNLQQQYDYVIYTRPDHVYLCDHPAPFTMNSSAVWCPKGEEYGGYPDRHLVGATATLLTAINVTQELVCNVARYHDVLVPAINVEQLQAKMWPRMGVAAQQFPRMFFTVRAGGDPAGWGRGMQNISKELEHHGMMLKYPSEFSSALTTCKPASMSAFVETIQQHTVPLFA